MQSIFRFARSLRGRGAWHRKRSHVVNAVINYLGRSLTRWRRHDAWLAFLETPPMAGVSSVDTILTERYQHRYIHKAWSWQKRMDVLRGHYEFALTHFPRPLFHMLYRERTVLLGKVTLRNGEPLSLVLKAPYRRAREGEMTLSLVDHQGMQLSYAAFSFMDDGKAIAIGCLQGAPNHAGLEAVRELTRQCHGLRPKNLLLSLIRALAEAFEVERVLGISNESHVFAGIADKVKADYNGFWRESGGTETADGFYAMAPHEPVRCETEVESKRRSEFRRREALRREACELVVAAFGFERAVAMPLAA